MDPEVKLGNFTSIYWAFCTIQPDGAPLLLQRFKTFTRQVNKNEDDLSSNWQVENKLV